MTTKTEEQLAEEKKQAQEQQEAEAGFAAGFGSVHAHGAPTKEPKTDAPAGGTPQGQESGGEEPTAGDQEGQPQETQPAEAQPDPWEGVPQVVRETLTGLRSQLEEINQATRTTQGRVSSLQSALDAGRKAAAQAGGEQPTDAQLEQAMETPEDWKKFETEYPEFAGPINAVLKARSRPNAPAVDLDALREEVRNELGNVGREASTRAEERALVRLHHPNWREDVKTDFYKQWIDTQPDEIKDLRKSAKAEDAIKLLDAFQKAKNAAIKKNQQQQQNQSRLRASVEPRGTPTAPTTGITDQEAWRRGFERAKGH